MAADGGSEAGNAGAAPRGRPSPGRGGLPADLAATAGLVVLADLVVLLPGVSASPLRVLVGLPFLLFLPGYALVAALFPEAGPGVDGGAEEGWPGTSGRIDGVERAALSFGLSLAVLPVVGLALHFTPWGIRLVPVLAALSLVTLGLVAVAARRRRQLSAAERFAVPYRDWLAAARADLFAPATRTDAALNVVLAVSLVTAAAFAGYAVAVPKETERFTEFYVLTEDEAGELVAEGHPTSLAVGEPTSFVLGVENHEHEPVTYAVVVRLQDVRVGADNRTVVEREAELDRFRVDLGHDEAWQEPYAVVPPFAGERLRLQFLLYRGDVPARPSANNAYHELHLWVDVAPAA